MISALFSKVGLYVLAGLAAAAAVAAILFGAREAGRNAEKVDQLKREAKGVQVRKKIEADVRGADDDELDDSLRPPAKRRVR